MAVVEIAAHNPVVGIISEVERTDGDRALQVGCQPVGIARQTVVDAVSVVAAHSHAQAGDGIVVYAGGNCIFIGYFELEHRGRAVLDPVFA